MYISMQVYWQENDLDNNLNFFSISSDGRVTCWSLIKNELHNTDIILIRLNTGAELDPGAGGLDLGRVQVDFKTVGLLKCNITLG